ncbi:putative adenylyltransferase/sulfurtransferase MoeZ [Polaribacter huanghezhanensis]|uniref:HesA/MoeB/ThiF family protein n=1 Tax=Polaribacter huanghezhanensis TaxID=1354726 RepID=UPI002648B0E8|nr:HesA/MoeB/ThiF family protein [Polaribacter huanghezhanensis]WKD85636.1 putative adenylyltransferase/sulfurtransferase MoeZ [Polaribacter huanghezhanensis]
MNKEELFKRQITLSEIGKVGQQKLQNTSVLVVGCGGLGSPIAVLLATSGIGKLHLVDFDTIDVTNLHRQVFFSLDDVGKSKAATLAKFIEKRAPFTEVIFTEKPITKSNVFELISEIDIVIDGTDSLPTKYLLNDACVIKKKPLVYGSLYKFDGYVSSFNVAQEDGSYSANLRDAFPKMATDIPNCEEAGTLNSIVSLIAVQQVNEVLKLVTGIGKPLTNELLIYNSLQNSQLKMKLQKAVSKPDIETIFKNETYFDASCEIQHPDWLISAEDLKKEMSGRAESRPIIISVLENLQTPFKVDKILPIQRLNAAEFHPQENKKYVLVCQKGISSYEATKQLKERFPTTTILSLAGGINGY